MPYLKNSTASEIDAYLQSRNSPMAGSGAAFVEAGHRYNVAPQLLVAIASAESSLGKHQNGSYNAFGLGPGNNYPDYATAINVEAASVAKDAGPGGTISKLQSVYAPSNAANDPTHLNANWQSNVLKGLGDQGIYNATGNTQVSLNGFNPHDPGQPSWLTGLELGGLAAAGVGAMFIPGGEAADPALAAEAASLVDTGAAAGGAATAGEAAGAAAGGGGIGAAGTKLATKLFNSNLGKTVGVGAVLATLGGKDALRRVGDFILGVSAAAATIMLLKSGTSRTKDFLAILTAVAAYDFLYSAFYDKSPVDQVERALGVKKTTNG